MITHLNTLVEQQVRRNLNVSPDEFEYLRHPSPEHLHDPICYKDMRELVMYLHKFRQKQDTDPNALLVIDGDYDTDGICASAILTAALSVFGFRFRVHIPTMAEGYGLSPRVVDTIRNNYPNVSLILTADNGIQAFQGVSYAKYHGIDVLITDHHPGAEHVPGALAVVDPNRVDDLYPFKGNSGACVAWKAMLAYAQLFEKDKLEYIQKLIVFAGLSNIADVMPIRNENRYTVVAALKIMDEILSKKMYKDIMDTPWTEYNTVFHGLYDLVTLLQESKDEKRRANGKKPVPLPQNEELFSWYLSPLLNAPRRVHDTCLEGLSAFLVSDTLTRRQVIRRLIELNDEKSKLRDKVLGALDLSCSHPVVCANTRKGISGLVAGKLSENSLLPSIVFSRYNPDDEIVIYEQVPEDGKLTGSGRSNKMVPLDLVIEKINQIHPGMITGGGHATAAGVTINASDYKEFCHAFAKVLPEVYDEVLKSGIVEVVPENKIVLDIRSVGKIIAEYQVVIDGEFGTEKVEIEKGTFAHDVKTAIDFLESLRPFGQDFEAETSFGLIFDRGIMDLPEFQWNPDFWKTFKFSIHGVEVLTFDEKWANTVKEALIHGEKVVANGQLKLNEFRGVVTPQMILSEK